MVECVDLPLALTVSAVSCGSQYVQEGRVRSCGIRTVLLNRMADTASLSVSKDNVPQALVEIA